MLTLFMLSLEATYKNELMSGLATENTELEGILEEGIIGALKQLGNEYLTPLCQFVNIDFNYHNLRLRNNRENRTNPIYQNNLQFFHGLSLTLDKYLGSTYEHYISRIGFMINFVLPVKLQTSERTVGRLKEQLCFYQRLFQPDLAAFWHPCNERAKKMEYDLSVFITRQQNLDGLRSLMRIYGRCCTSPSAIQHGRKCSCKNGRACDCFL